EREDQPEFSAADAAARIVGVLGPGGPTQELVPLMRRFPEASLQGVGLVVVQLDAEVWPFAAVRVLLDRFPADDAPAGDGAVEVRRCGRGIARARGDAAE